MGDFMKEDSRPRGLKTACFVLLLAVCFGCESNVATIGPRQDYRAVQRVLEQFIEDEIESKQLPALSIALVEDQEIVWASGFGYADPADSVLASAQTVYRVGSVSKLFTDIAIMQLVERDELDLDAPITTYLPDFGPENSSGKPITLRQLMSHRSGLVREPPVGHYFDPTEPSLAQTVSSLNNTELVYAPETVAKYSNAAIAAVGYVLERTQQEPFASYLTRTVLEPLGMANSAFEPDAGIVSNLAKGFMWTLDGRVFEAPTFGLGMAPAGSMYSTVEDLARFISALLAGGEGVAGRILSQATLERMWTPQYAEPNATSGFGIGFGVSDFLGFRRVGHNGAIYGFATELAVLPEEKIGVAVVTTKDFANSIAARVANAALEAMLDVRAGREPSVLRSTDPVSPDLARQLRGRYRSKDTGVELSEWAGRLFLQGDVGGARAEVRAFGDTLVVDDVHAFGIRLVPVESGIVFGGDTLVRVQDRRPAPAPSEWSGLIGEYGWDHNTLYVLERDGALNVLIEWLLYYPLEQVSRDEFKFPPGGLYAGERVVFTRDEDGRAGGVVAGGVSFERRAVGAEVGETFRIEPVAPVEGLREVALAADPPIESGLFREPDLTELVGLDSTFQLDVRYASTNNFMSAVFYDEPRAFLQRPAAEALVRAHRQLEYFGFRLLIHDAYRPWYVTKMFWDATPEEHKLFVANPASGSRHNRGSAVDMTLFDLQTGRPVEMVGGYDEFSERSYARYPGGTSSQRWLRDLLRRVVEAEDFTVYEFEWWHFDHEDWAEYPILNQTFAEIGASGGER
jgi:CubicO group peptidase (beta-lactamase class C family)/D-alanyl-D-alanine dipeptidase